MTTQQPIKKEININVPPAKVWEALTSPAYISQYMYGTKAVSDWKKGSSLKFVGTWDGTPYEDKGTILELIERSVLEYSYWSSFTGIPDIPENYAIVRFDLKAADKATQVQLTQRNSPTQTMHENSDKGWDEVLRSIKNILENENTDL